jgi:hypothetical protein
MFDRILASLGSTTRCLGLVLALLLGLFAPAYAGPTSPAPAVEVQPAATDDQRPLVTQVYLLAYRAHGPPSGAYIFASIPRSVGYRRASEW